jgi:hypothetical protein
MELGGEVCSGLIPHVATHCSRPFGRYKSPFFCGRPRVLGFGGLLLCLGKMQHISLAHAQSLCLRGCPLPKYQVCYLCPTNMFRQISDTCMSVVYIYLVLTLFLHTSCHQTSLTWLVLFIMHFQIEVSLCETGSRK